MRQPCCGYSTQLRAVCVPPEAHQHIGRHIGRLSVGQLSACASATLHGNGLVCVQRHPCTLSVAARLTALTSGSSWLHKCGHGGELHRHSLSSMPYCAVCQHCRVVVHGLRHVSRSVRGVVASSEQCTEGTEGSSAAGARAGGVSAARRWATETLLAVFEHHGR